MSNATINRDLLHALGLAVVALAVSAGLLVSGYLLLVPVLHPEFKPYIESDRADPITISGNRFQPVVFGDGGVDGSAAVISALAEAFPEDHAVLVHRRLLQADQFPFLRFHISDGLHPGVGSFLFWRSASAPAELHTTPLRHAGDGVYHINLSKEEHWQGTILETSIGVFGDLRGASFRLEEIAFLPYGSETLLKAIWAEWMAFEPWNQALINAYRGVAKSSLLYPAPIAAAIVGCAILLLFCAQWILSIRRGKRAAKFSPSASIVILGLAGWVVLDGLWQSKLLKQSAETLYLFAGKSHHEKMLRDWDADYYAFAHTIKKEYLPTNTQKIPVLATDDVPGAFGFRMEYHLLPEHIAVLPGFSYPGAGSNFLSVADTRSIQRIQHHGADYFILLTPEGVDATSIDFKVLTGHELPGGAKPLYANKAGILFTTVPTESTPE